MRRQRISHILSWTLFLISRLRTVNLKFMFSSVGRWLVQLVTSASAIQPFNHFQRCKMSIQHLGGALKMFRAVWHSMSRRVLSPGTATRILYANRS
ncbi:hypothetical protein F4778DRAFT_761867 [Xylariomycetidae sp. FL2044]|nr:hypothetical protein F4778DRAFT_761867 [Xylariomycetidae sp. FL2044]